MTTCFYCNGTGRQADSYCAHCVKGQRMNCMANHRPQWRVLQYHCNFSAFSGYHQTPSNYSGVRCTAPGCGRYWRWPVLADQGLTGPGGA